MKKIGSGLVVSALLLGLCPARADQRAEAPIATLDDRTRCRDPGRNLFGLSKSKQIEQYQPWSQPTIKATERDSGRSRGKISETILYWDAFVLLGFLNIEKCLRAWKG